jgi:Zn-dependent protease
MVPGMDTILPLAAMYLMFVFSTTCHEAAHAFAAHRGGDDTAYSLGHVTLDPIPHILRSPMGMVLAPLLSAYYFGYPLGWASVPYDAQWGARHPLRRALMSFSGPLANFTLALTSIVLLRILIGVGVFHLRGAGVRSGFVLLSEGVAKNSALGALAYLLSYLFTLNLMLGIFNLVPLPPLDGSGVAEGLSPRILGRFYARLREIPAHELLGWILASQLFRYLDGPMNHLIVLALGLSDSL